jgi:hypothetical protein
MVLIAASWLSTAVIILLVVLGLLGIAMALSRRGAGIDAHPTPERHSGEQAPGAGKSPSEPSA